MKFISEVKSDRLMYFRNPEARKSYFMQQDELVKLISVYAFSSRLKSTDFPVKVFVVFNNTSQEVRTIVSNDLGLPEKKAVETYLERWAIERIFRELKDSFCFDHYQVRQNGYLYRSISTSLKGKGINECRQALLKLILFSSYQALRKNNANITSPPH